MDNKPMELEAISAIQHRLSLYDFRYSNPNYDQNGGDFFVIADAGEGMLKALKCQSKGRNITNKDSSVVIPAGYVTDSFVLFVYLKDGYNCQIYLFTKDDFKQWNNKDGSFSMTFGKSYLQNEQEYIFDEKKIDVLNTLLDGITRFSYAEIFEGQDIISAYYTLWKKTGSMPDLAALNYWLDNYNSAYITLPQLLFLLCALAKMDIDNGQLVGLDSYFFDLKKFCDIYQVDEHLIGEHRPQSLVSCVTYNHTYLSSVSYDNDFEQIDGWHLHFGDSEEYFNIDIFRDGMYNFRYFEK